jgi:RNA polymerase sigma factor (sigma-70 family)
MTPPADAAKIRCQIVAEARDPIGVNELGMLRDDELVRLFALARDKGDRKRAVEIWDEIVTRHFDRVVAMVGAWRYPGSGDRVQDKDRDEAISLAFWKVGNRLVGTFKGTTLPELRAAIRRAVDYACRDTLRRVGAYEKHQAGSLDEQAGDDSDLSRYEEELSDDGGFDEFERGEERRQATDRVAAALEKLPANQRRVLELTLEGMDVPQIAAALKTSTDNVYQLRSRGMKKLKEVLGDGLD